MNSQNLQPESFSEATDGHTNALRSPAEVMKLERLGSFHPTRLSFTRTLVRRMHREKWRFEIGHNSLDEFGIGHLVYFIHTPSGSLSFIAFSTPLDDRDRTDRVIAEKWDMSFTLFNGIATESDIDRLNKQLPLQEAGRMSQREIVMSRANKSVRLFESVVSHLSSGRQPSVSDIAAIGYLVRTTAVYGNGKFGLLDFDHVKQATPFNLPFQAEMLTVYMARQLSIDLVEHIARKRGKRQFVPLSRSLRRAFGVGNATGLGMAPFLVGHPQLINQWMYTRETAISRVKAVEEISPAVVSRFEILIERVSRHLEQWNTLDQEQECRIQVLKNEVKQLTSRESSLRGTKFPWNHLVEWASAHASLECQELVHSLILELHPELVNELEQHMGVIEFTRLDARMTVEQLQSHIENNYGWALQIDFSNPSSEHFFWYVSQEKEEPRRGERYNEPGSELEMRIGVARDVARLYQALCVTSAENQNCSVAEFLLVQPHFRHIITRIHSLEGFPFAEIQDNLLGAECLPINILRCKLSIFGATRFDPKSDLWTRITLFQGAPLPDELNSENSDDWAFPVVSADS